MSERLITHFNQLLAAQYFIKRFLMKIRVKLIVNKSN